MNLAFQTVNRTPHCLELSVIVRRDRFVPLLFEVLDTRFNGGFVDTNHFVVFVLDAEGFGNCDEQVLLVQLRVALNRFVIDVFRDVAQLSERFVFRLDWTSRLSDVSENRKVPYKEFPLQGQGDRHQR